MKICPECHGEFQGTIHKCPEEDIDLQSENINSLIGSCIADRYQIMSVLGSGGSGIVYKAHQLKMDKSVAIKLMHSHMMIHANALKSFYEKAKIIAQLKHHNIVTLYDFGISSTNQPFLAMDYIEGQSLNKYTETNGPFSLEQIRPILAQIIDGLVYAHSEGIVHQDLKPENIMLTDVGRSADKVSIVDFGLLTLCSTEKELIIPSNKKQQLVGSPYYMSPEQCLSNSTVDARSDIYSLSIVFYEALSNNLPFKKKSALSMMDSHVRETPNSFKDSNPELLGLQACTELTKVFNKAMAKNPDDRYADIKEFGLELDEALVRDAVKLKAIKHRGLAAEQVLVHAKETFQSVKAIDKRQFEEQKLQLDNGSKFLSRQAEIEEAYLNSPTIELMATEPVQKENYITGVLKRLKEIFDSQKNNDIAPYPVAQAIECPNCKVPLKQGIQFCLNCQRTTFVPAIHTIELSQTYRGKSFTHHGIDGLDLKEQLKIKNKLQNLRQQKVFALDKVQQILNYALALAIMIGGIMVLERYFIVNIPWQKLSQLISPK